MKTMSEVERLRNIIHERIATKYYDRASKYFPDFNLRFTDRPKFDKMMKRYYLKDEEDMEVFKSNLKELGNLNGFNDAQIKKIYEVAWDEGHDGGTGDIFNYFLDFMRLYLEIKSLEDKGIELLGEPCCHT